MKSFNFEAHIFIYTPKMTVDVELSNNFIHHSFTDTYFRHSYKNTFSKNLNVYCFHI